MVSPQKWANPAVSMMVTATAPSDKREMVKSTVISRLMMKMASRVRPMLMSMSLTMMLIMWYIELPPPVKGSSQTNTLPSKP